MHGATDTLRAVANLDCVVHEGQEAPDFTLNDSQGRPAHLDGKATQRERRLPVIFDGFTQMEKFLCEL